MADRLARRAAAAYLSGMLTDHRADRGVLADLLHSQAERHGDRALATALEKHRGAVALIDEVEAELAQMCGHAEASLDDYWREHEGELRP